MFYFIGFPSEIFYHGIEIYMLTIVTIVCAPLSAFIFVPIFFDMKLTSVFTVSLAKCFRQIF